MANIDAVELGKWERGETERGKVRQFFIGAWYNYTPKVFGWTLSPVRLFFGTLRGLSLLVVSLSPTWLKLYEASRVSREGEAGRAELLSWEQAIAYSAVIPSLLLYNHIYDKVIKDYKPKSTFHKVKKKVSLELCGITGGLNGTVKVKKKEFYPQIDSVCGRILDCIKNVAKLHLGDYEVSHLDATLILFNDAECATMVVASRTTPARPTGVVRSSADMMAYYVAKSRKTRAIHDFLCNHPFPKTSLTGDSPGYRSILMIPLLDTFGGRPDTCVGVVTVDSSQPYHFWPGNGEALVLELQPLLALLTFFLNLKEPHCLSCVAQP